MLFVNPRKMHCRNLNICTHNNNNNNILVKKQSFGNFGIIIDIGVGIGIGIVKISFLPAEFFRKNKTFYFLSSA